MMGPNVMVAYLPLKLSRINGSFNSDGGRENQPLISPLANFSVLPAEYDDCPLSKSYPTLSAVAA